MRAALALLALASLLACLWWAVPQRIDTQQTIGVPPLPHYATETAVTDLTAPDAIPLQIARDRLAARPSATERGSASDRERTLDFLDELLAKMSDREIVDAISQLTELEAEDFETIRDVRKHVHRLAEIAVGIPLAEDSPGTPVTFGRSVNPEGRTVLEDSVFHDRVRAIYAVFPVDPLESDAVYVKWSAVDATEPLHLDRYPVDTSRDQNYVWLEPGEAWSEGSYQVDVYAADEELTLLASGRFEIVPIAQLDLEDAESIKKIAALGAAK